MDLFIEIQIHRHSGRELALLKQHDLSYRNIPLYLEFLSSQNPMLTQPIEPIQLVFVNMRILKVEFSDEKNVPKGHEPTV